jgi:hypothetical protein
MYVFTNARQYLNDITLKAEGGFAKESVMRVFLKYLYPYLAGYSQD